jgi:hypothetical protein
MSKRKKGVVVTFRLRRDNPIENQVYEALLSGANETDEYGNRIGIRGVVTDRVLRFLGYPVEMFVSRNAPLTNESVASAVHEAMSEYQDTMLERLEDAIRETLQQSNISLSSDTSPELGTDDEIYHNLAMSAFNRMRGNNE